jgi:hypothetical protein
METPPRDQSGACVGHDWLLSSMLKGSPRKVEGNCGPASCPSGRSLRASCERRCMLSSYRGSYHYRLHPARASGPLGCRRRAVCFERRKASPWPRTRRGGPRRSRIADMICGPAIIVMASGRMCRFIGFMMPRDGAHRTFEVVGELPRNPFPGVR